MLVPPFSDELFNIIDLLVPHFLGLDSEILIFALCLENVLKDFGDTDVFGDRLIGISVVNSIEV